MSRPSGGSAFSNTGADLTASERFIWAVMRADRASAERLLTRDSGLVAGLSGTERAALVDAAEACGVPEVCVPCELQR